MLSKIRYKIFFSLALFFPLLLSAQHLSNAEDYFKRGVAYLKKGKDEMAARDFEKAIELLTDLSGGRNSSIRIVDPNISGILNNLAVIAIHQHDYESALSRLNQGLRLNSRKPELWYHRGMAQLGLGNMAMADLDASAWVGRSQVRFKVKNYLAAYFDMQKGLHSEARPAVRSDAYNLRGALFLALNRLDEALADFNQSLRLNAENVGALNNRGTIYTRKGEIALARTDFGAALQLDPQNPITWFNRGNLLVKDGKLVDALADYDQSIRLKPSAETYLNRGLVHWKLGFQKESEPSRRREISCGRRLGLSVKQVARPILEVGISRSLEEVKKSCHKKSLAVV
jgi:tetratricopeptide (TPR) repeat protein